MTELPVETRDPKEFAKTRKVSYQQYQSLGGIINEGAYRSAMDRAKQVGLSPEEPVVNQGDNTADLEAADLAKKKAQLEESLRSQAKRIARFSKVFLPKEEFRDVVILYGILRTDVIPGEPYHHGQMSDERLFAEALRMLNYPEELGRVIRTYHTHQIR